MAFNFSNTINSVSLSGVGIISIYLTLSFKFIRIFTKIFFCYIMGNCGVIRCRNIRFCPGAEAEVFLCFV